MNRSWDCMCDSFLLWLIAGHILLNLSLAEVLEVKYFLVTDTKVQKLHCFTKDNAYFMWLIDRFMWQSSHVQLGSHLVPEILSQQFWIRIPTLYVTWT